MSTASSLSYSSATWLDLDVVAVGPVVITIPNNGNRAWLYDQTQPRMRPTVLSYVGAFPRGFAG
eukprot:3429107-Pyramimonas_sp.AAC.1